MPTTVGRSKEQNRETKIDPEKMSDEAQFLNLTSHLINDILSTLPTRTIVRCKCVCKTWLNLLSESKFINLHLSRSLPCLIVCKQDAFSSDPSCFSLVEFEDELDHHDFLYVPEDKIKPPGICAENNMHMTMIGTINGLVCLHESGYRHDELYLWNPSTQELINLPTPPERLRYYGIVQYYFGLGSQTGQYKVIRITQEIETKASRVLKSNCDVYTLGEENQGLGLWRRIENAPFVFYFRSFGVFLNGNLHWLINENGNIHDDPDSMSCFHLEKELFLPFPAPPGLSKGQNLAGLEVVGGCLSLCDNSSEYEIVIWVMKEYGITKQWSKEIVIDLEPPKEFRSPELDDVVRVLKFFKDGDILLLLGGDLLLSYDSQRKILRQSSVHRLLNDDEMNEEGSVEGSYYCIDAIEYVSSFISIKNFGIEVTQKNK